jgi:hypothetical protein
MDTLSQASCAPANGLSFVCGLKKPEDIVRIPGSRWLVASGVDPSATLSIVDTDAKTAKPFYTAAVDQIRADRKTFPKCPAPPGKSGFAPHGLSLHSTSTPGTYRLYAVTHISFEGIHVFAVDARGPEPKLTWLGCVALPEGTTGNAVASFDDGTIIATIRGAIAYDGPKASPSGVTIGAVASWKPGDERFHQLSGTEMFGTNGIEVSPDGKEFYVVSVDTGTVSVFSRADTRHPLRQSRAPLTSLDNIRWTDGHLIGAGKMFDEPACGGTRRQASDRGQGVHDCIRGYAAVELNPTTMDWRIVAYAEPNPAFDGVATAVPVGNTLWLSSFLQDRIAYRPLPGAK